MAIEKNQTEETLEEELDEELLDEPGEEELDEDSEESEDSEGSGEQEEPNLYTQEQVEAAVRARVNTFNKKIERSKSYEKTVRKISELTGLTTDQLISRLEGMSDAEQAKILGLTPQQMAARRQANETNRLMTSQNSQLKRELEEQKLTSDPKFKDFGLFKDEIYDLIEENPNLSLKQAYTLVKGELGTQAAVRDAEQRAVAKMTKSSNQRVISSTGAGPKKSAPKIAASTVAAAKRVGMDPAEYAAFSEIDSLDKFEAMRARKKGK